MTDKKTIHVYLTKYALSSGIVEAAAEQSQHDPNKVIVRPQIKHGYMQVFNGSDWHLTRENAVEKAEAMRAKKIASLKKQITKLEALKF